LLFELGTSNYSNQVKSSQVKASQIKSSQIKSNQIKTIQIKSNQIISIQFNSIQFNSIQFKQQGDSLCSSFTATMSAKIESTKQNISQLQGKFDETLKSKNDSTLAGAANGGASAAIRAPPQTRTRRTLKGHFGKITALHWGGDSRSLVSASQDGNLLLWNACTSNKLRSITLKSSYVMAVGIEQKRGNMIASGGLDNLCTIFNMSAGSSNGNTPESSTAAHELASHDGFLSCCRFISEENIITSSGDSSCIRWDIPTGKVLETFREHEDTAMFLSLRPDDPNVFASCSVDRTAKVWDVRTPGKSTMTFTGHLGDLNSIDFMPCDGNTFATCSNDGTARVWDMRSYQEVARFGTLV